MKITDPDVIKNGEKDLIDAVTDDLDLDVVRQILEKKIAATALAAKGGQIVVHNNEIAFKLDFDLNLSGSLMFDREGNYISDAGTVDDTAEDVFEEADMGPVDIDNDPMDMDDSLEETPEDEQIDASDTNNEIGELAGEIEPDLPENIENDLDDDLKIDLPDYSLDDEDADEEADEDVSEEFPDPLETEQTDEDDLDTDVFDPLDDDSPLLDVEPPEDDIGPDDIQSDDIIEDDAMVDDIVDDDINDILKESQEFWDQNKDS